MHLLTYFVLGAIAGGFGIVFLAYRFPDKATKIVQMLENITKP